MYHALIMAGGSGTRMWPLSRKQTPKQALPLLEERSMFRVTAERLAPLITLDRVWVVTNAEMAEVFKAQVPGIPTSNYVIEPNARDSGPAAGLGLAHIHAVDPDATVAILSADHHITDVPAFLSTLALAEKQAQHGHIVLIGINPTFASTAFGYIEKGRALVENVFEALRFTEKPREDIAEQYFSGGMHSWNSGMFIMKAATGMDEFAKQHPAFAQALLAMQPHIGASSYATALDTAWNLSPRKSIDYAIMENAQALAVIPVDIGWSDIGSWAALMDALPKDAHENAISGEHVSIDTFDTLVRGSNGRLIATIGVARLAIIDTPDALLICSLDRVQDVKKVVDELKRKKRDDLV